MINFVKYHGLGNDFIIVNEEEVKNDNWSEKAIELCSRHMGVGADGFIVVRTNPELEMIYYNADGSRALMCGNGIRCFVKYVLDEKIRLRDNYYIKVGKGYVNVVLKQKQPFLVEVNMGKAIFNEQKDLKEIQFKNEKVNLKGYFVHIGVSHLVLLLEKLKDFSDSELVDIASQICDRYYDDGINVNFVNVIDENNISVKTVERGSGLTLSCGSGCCASAFVTSKLGFTSKEVNVQLSQGILNVKNLAHIYMTGTATKVFKGEL